MSSCLRDGCTVGILAGNGAYPNTLASCLLRRDFRVVVAGIDGQFSDNLPKGCGPVEVFPLGALGATARFFLRNRAKGAFMAGGVNREGAWRRARPDRHALTLAPYALFGGDDLLLRSVARTIEKLGVTVCNPRPFIGEFLAIDGVMAGPDPNSKQLEDIKVAWLAAHDLGLKDKGQSAIACRGKVVALEDRRGTDAMLARAPGPGAVMAKVKKIGQDSRFDMPAIGPSTAIAADKVGLGAIAVETQAVLLLDRDRLFEICNEKRISLVGM